MAEPEETDAPDPKPAPKPKQKSVPGRRLRRFLFWLRASCLLCMTPLFFAIAAAVMLIDRDISAPSWVVDRIEARTAELMNGGDLQFGAITLRISPDLHPTVRLSDIQLRDVDGGLVARIPLVEGLVSPRGLILQQDVLMQQIHLAGAQINLRREGDGAVSVAFGSEARAAGQARSLPQLLDQFDTLLEQPLLEALEVVAADGLIVNFDDARAQRAWLVDGGSIALDLRDDETELRGNFAVLSGRAGVTRVGLSYNSPRGSRSAQIALNIDDAIASDIAAQSPALNWLTDVEAPISAALRTGLDEDGALGPLNATLEIGAGVLQPNDATQPIAFESAKAYLEYNPARHLISFTNIELETEWGGLRATGDAYLREIRDGLPGALLAQFQFTDVSLNPADVYDVPIKVDGAEADLRLRFAPFSVEVGQLVISDGPTRVSASGEIAATDTGWQMALDASINEIPPEKVLGYWPPTVKPRTWKWLNDNLSGGRLVDVAAGLRAGPDTSLNYAVNFGFAETDVRFMRFLPPIENGYGVITIIDNQLVVSLDEGKLQAAEGGVLDAAGTNFTITTLTQREAPAIADLQLKGSVTAALSVLNQRPFEFLDKANLPVSSVDGRAEVAGTVAFPLKPRIAQDELSFDIGADVTQVRSDTLIPDRDISSSGLRVEAKPTGITIAGPARVGTVPANITWEQRFGPGQAGKSQLRGQIELSSRFLDEFGIGLPPGSLEGRGNANVAIDLVRDTPPRLTMRSDLRGVRVALPAVGWAKSANTAGELLVEGTLGSVPAISNLSISGGGLSARGRVSLTPAGQLNAATFSRIRLDDWLDAPITLRGRGRGRPVGVEIGGGTVDLRRAQFGASNSDGGPVQIALDRLQISNGIALTGFQGDFNGQGGFSGQFRAQLNGTTAVRGTVAPRNGRSAVRVLSDDAGGIGRAAGFLRNGVGGSLDLTLLPSEGAGSFDGFLAIRDFRLRDAPTMAALLDAISVVGLIQQMNGQGLVFEEIDARFRLNPQQVIVTEASAVGPGLGISVDGIYTLASKQLDLQGVVSPFFIVNSIGSILTRRGEGLIGVNFNIGGTSDAPAVSVNPLSAFTPGMFREIFRRPPPEVGQ